MKKWLKVTLVGAGFAIIGAIIRNCFMIVYGVAMVNTAIIFSKS